MENTYYQAKQLLGLPIIVECHDGNRYHGILRHVSSDAIWLDLLPHEDPTINSNLRQEDSTEEKNDTDIQNVQFGIPGFGPGGFGGGLGNPGYGGGFGGGFGNPGYGGGFGGGFGNPGYGGGYPKYPGYPGYGPIGGAGLVLPLYALLALGLAATPFAGGPYYRAPYYRMPYQKTPQYRAYTWS